MGLWSNGYDVSFATRRLRVRMLSLAFGTSFAQARKSRQVHFFNNPPIRGLPPYQPQTLRERIKHYQPSTPDPSGENKTLSTINPSPAGKLEKQDALLIPALSEENKTLSTRPTRETDKNTGHYIPSIIPHAEDPAFVLFFVLFVMILADMSSTPYLYCLPATSRFFTLLP